MFIQTENTPNPNSLKFLPGRKVSNDGPLEILKQEDTNNYNTKPTLLISNTYAYAQMYISIHVIVYTYL